MFILIYSVSQCRFNMDSKSESESTFSFEHIHPAFKIHQSIHQTRSDSDTLCILKTKMDAAMREAVYKASKMYGGNGMIKLESAATHKTINLDASNIGSKRMGHYESKIIDSAVRVESPKRVYFRKCDQTRCFEDYVEDTYVENDTWNEMYLSV